MVKHYTLKAIINQLIYLRSLFHNGELIDRDKWEKSLTRCIDSLHYHEDKTIAYERNDNPIQHSDGACAGQPDVSIHWKPGGFSIDVEFS